MRGRAVPTKRQVVIGLSVVALVFFALIGEVGPVGATVVAYVNPAVAVGLGVLLLGEPFTLPIACGFVLILGGSYLSTGPTSAHLTPRDPARAPSSRGAP